MSSNIHRKKPQSNLEWRVLALLFLRAGSNPFPSGVTYLEIPSRVAARELGITVKALKHNAKILERRGLVFCVESSGLYLCLSMEKPTIAALLVERAA